MSKQSTPASRRAGSPSTRAGGTSAARRAGVRRRATQSEGSNVTFGFPLDRKNWIGVIAGVVVIIIGYLVMSTGISDDPATNNGIWNSAAAVTFGPILLGLGYCVIIPIALLYRFNKDQDADIDGAAADNA